MINLTLINYLVKEWVLLPYLIGFITKDISDSRASMTTNSKIIIQISGKEGKLNSCLESKAINRISLQIKRNTWLPIKEAMDWAGVERIFTFLQLHNQSRCSVQHILTSMKYAQLFQMYDILTGQAYINCKVPLVARPYGSYLPHRPLHCYFRRAASDDDDAHGRWCVLLRATGWHRRIGWVLLRKMIGLLLARMGRRIHRKNC